MRIVRRDPSSSARPALTGGEVKELLLLAAEHAVESATCANATAAPRGVEQGEIESRSEPVVCGAGAFAYMRVQAGPECTPAAARLTRGEESAEVLLVARHTAASCDGAGTCWLVVARAPPAVGGRFTMELLAEDGAPCQRNLVGLKPNSL